MMAGALGSLIPTKPVNHQPRWRSPVTSANMRRRHRQRPIKLPKNNSDQEEEEEEISGFGRAVVAALNSDVPPQLPVSKRVIEEVAEAAPPGAVALRGSDVLMALQKATVRKERKRKKRGLGGGGGRGGGGDRVEAGSGEVRPLNVKSEWGARLEELERRLQEFLV